MNAKRLSLMLLCWLGLAPFVAAQTAAYRYELLSLVPDDFAVCVVMHDLRGHAERWEQSDWLKAFRQSPVGKSLFGSPEMQQLTRWQSEMKKHLDLDWPTIRDDLLGDTLLMSYSPGPKNKPDDERGLFLLHLRKPERFVQIIDKLNDIQKKTGELKSLTDLKHKGSVYHRRVQGDKTQFYFVQDSLAAVTTNEAIMHQLLERRATASRDNPWTKRFQQAGAESAFVTMCVNPRTLEPDIIRQSKKNDAIPAYWSALEAIFVTVTLRDEAELRISIQANPRRLPAWAKSAFGDTVPTSSLWQRFPERSILTLATTTDFAGAAEALKLLMPEKDRKKLANEWKGGLGALLPDPLKDILPNIGPDWGVCVLPSKDPQNLPQAIFALAVAPGAKGQKVDEALFSGAQFFAGIAILEHNKNHPNSIIRLEKVMQGNVEVKYLANDTLFPAGFQPACALKDGFFLLATSPEAIADFRVHGKNQAERKDSPLLRLSTPELAKLLEHRRAHIVASLIDRQKMSEKSARQNFDDVISFLGLFDHLTLSHHGDAGQASWIVRLTPTRSSK